LPKVLVVDDEESIRKLVRVNLIARGFQVLTAADGEDALKLANLECPDLILLDIMMPGMSGWDVLTTLKADQKLRGIPVIVMTASVDKWEEDRARSMGAVDYLSKPFSTGELMRQVRLVIGE